MLKSPYYYNWIPQVRDELFHTPFIANRDSCIQGNYTFRIPYVHCITAIYKHPQTTKKSPLLEINGAAFVVLKLLE